MRFMEMELLSGEQQRMVDNVGWRTYHNSDRFDPERVVCAKLPRTSHSKQAPRCPRPPRTTAPKARPPRHRRDHCVCPRRGPASCLRPGCWPSAWRSARRSVPPPMPPLQAAPWHRPAPAAADRAAREPCPDRERIAGERAHPPSRDQTTSDSAAGERATTPSAATTTTTPSATTPPSAPEEESTPSSSGGAKKPKLPAITNVWLIELDGTGFTEAIGPTGCRALHHRHADPRKHAAERLVGAKRERFRQRGRPAEPPAAGATPPCSIRSCNRPALKAQPEPHVRPGHQVN